MGEKTMKIRRRSSLGYAGDNYFIEATPLRTKARLSLASARRNSVSVELWLSRIDFARLWDASARRTSISSAHSKVVGTNVAWPPITESIPPMQAAYRFFPSTTMVARPMPRGATQSICPAKMPRSPEVARTISYSAIPS